MRGKKFRLLFMKEVMARTGLSRHMINRGVETGHFPLYCIVGAGRRGWTEASIEAWERNVSVPVFKQRVGEEGFHRRAKKQGTPP